MSLVVRQVLVGGFDQNYSYVIFERESNATFVVDPSGNLFSVMRMIEQQELTVEGVLLTHSHADHYDQLDALLSLHPVRVYVHQNGADEIKVANLYSLADGQTIQLGSASITALYTPGHTDDSVCYLIDAKDSAERVPLLISGDTLFVGRCGKTTPEQIGELYASLQRLKTLPPETIIFPGHNYGEKPVSTIGYENVHNPFLSAPNLESFSALRLGSMET